MLTERHLLLDIISDTPSNSVWNISDDSWENIPNVIPELKSSIKDYGWEVTITEGNKSYIMEVINR